MTPASIDKKKLLKQKALYSQKESARNADDSRKMGQLNSKLRQGITTNNGKSQRMEQNNKSTYRENKPEDASKRSVKPSPLRNNNTKSQANILHKRN